MEVVHQILKDLKMTLGRGLLFKKKGCKDIVLHSDADWVGQTEGQPQGIALSLGKSCNMEK